MKTKTTWGMLLLMAAIMVIIGCSRKQEDEIDNSAASDNVLITETGEVVKLEPIPTPIPTSLKNNMEKENMQLSQEEDVAPTPAIELDVPVHEQVITEEDQTEPEGKGLQLVFLGDSIFDNNRDGTGIPYLTAAQCDADVFNLAIGGSSASLD